MSWLDCWACTRHTNTQTHGIKTIWPLNLRRVKRLQDTLVRHIYLQNQVCKKNILYCKRMDSIVWNLIWFRRTGNKTFRRARYRAVSRWENVLLRLLAQVSTSSHHVLVFYHFFFLELGVCFTGRAPSPDTSDRAVCHLWLPVWGSGRVPL